MAVAPMMPFTTEEAWLSRDPKAESVHLEQFPVIPAEGLAPSCAEAGVMGALPGIVGAMMAAEAIKEITGAGASLRGRLVIHDALWAESRQIAVRRDPACPVCGAIA